MGGTGSCPWEREGPPTFIHEGVLPPGAGAGAADSRDRQQPSSGPPAGQPARRPAPATASGSPPLASSSLLRRGPPHSREVLIAADLGGERSPVLAQMLAGGPQHLPQRGLPLG